MPELPFEIWKERINNEIKILKHMKVIEENSARWQENNVELWINLNALGFVVVNKMEKIKVKPQLKHRIFIKINRSFPYPGGIDFAWYSNIFHPNIHPVELRDTNNLGTGYICLNVLRQWSRLSDLETTVKSLEKLVENPNPEDPLQYNICIEAAEFFKNNSMEELKRNFKSDEEEKEKKVDEEDEIIIIKE
ncbi:MAG: ubiquitin-conjugating enzyme E2 [Candidatus Hodarchaeota archaeon]